MKTLLKPVQIAKYIILISIIYCVLYNKLWNDEDKIICWDVVSYYAYLPAFFIYNDITLKFTENYKGPHKYNFWWQTTFPNGCKLIKTTMGLSFLYLPFFFMGHIAAHLLKYDTGGYSPPYKAFLMIGTILYLMIGLFFLKKILEKYFNQWIIAITFLTIVWTTNLYYYSAIESTMSHAYNFTLFILFIWFSMKWYEKQSFFNTIALGLLSGIISLVRPSNIIVALIFLLYNITNFNDFKERIRLYISNYWKILLILFCAILVWIPQFFYWKTVTGHWLFYSYGNDERFFFTNPQIINGLFSFRNGWFLYTPIMIFAVCGIPLLFTRIKEFSLLIPIFLLLNIYIIFSWWCWWYGGSFGQRAFIDSYGLMSIPLALSIKWISEQKKYLKYFLILIFVLLSIKSIQYTFQSYHVSIHGDYMTKDAYIDSFFRIKPSKRFKSLLRPPDYEKAKLGIQAYEEK